MSNGDDPEDGGPTILRIRHILRFYGKDNSGEEGGQDNSHCWVDMAIMDRIILQFGRGHDYLQTQVKFKYPELDEEQFDEDGVKVRVLEKKRIANADDPNQFVEVPATKTVVLEFASGAQYLRTVLKFDNSKKNTARMVRKRTIYHYEIDDEFMHDATSAVDAEGRALRLPPRDPKEYISAIKKSGSSKAIDSKLDVEVTDAWKSVKGSGHQWLTTKWIWNHKDDPVMQDPLVPVPNTGG